MDRTIITDLRAIHPDTNKTYAQMLVDEIPKYKSIVKDFLLASEYEPDYSLAETETEPEPEELYTDSTHALYISAATEEELDVFVMNFPSVKSAQTEWISSLETYAILNLAPADAGGIIVGDVAVGREDSLDFIRGNIGIRIWGINGNSVVDVAKEIDAQIIKALEDAEN